MAEEPSHVGTEFDIFVRKPKQSSTVETKETINRPIASVNQTDIEFVIPGDSDTYVDLDLKLFVKGKLQNENTDLSETDYTAVVNNLLHSLFSRCTIYLNGTQITGHGVVPLSRVYRDHLDVRQRCRKLAPHDALLAARRRGYAGRRLLKTRTDK